MFTHVITGAFGRDDPAQVFADSITLLTEGSSYGPTTGNTDPDQVSVEMQSNSTLYNMGFISGHAAGLKIAAAGAQLFNMGSISGRNVAIRADFGCTLNNSGTITGVLEGLSFAGGGNEVALIQNSGTIRAAYAVLATDAAMSVITLNNSGNITGTSGDAIALDSLARADLTNSGQIHGSVQLRANGQVNLANSGTIHGDVRLLSYDENVAVQALYNGIGQGLVTGTVFGSESADRLFGAALEDRLSGDEGDDHLRGRGGDDALDGGLGNDLLYGGTEDDDLNGGLGNDLLYGGTGNDGLLGDAGAERLYGGAGDDALNGGVEADRLYGGADDDELIGGLGADRLYGGAGEDAFIYNSAAESAAAGGIDTLYGFSRAQDVIDLTALTGTGRYIGDAAFSKRGTFEVRAVLNSSSQVESIYVDQNGDGVADMVIRLLNQTALLTANNFDL